MRASLPVWLTVSAALSQPSLAATTESYDYIIVGAGTCGLLLANRLSRDANYTVAVIDPGSDQRHNPNVTDPFGWFGLPPTPVNWNYSSVPQASADGRIIEFDAGHGIGGTSLMNGMTYIRGDRAQFDAWEALGNLGWNWDTLLKYYKQLEKFYPPEAWQVAVGASFESEYHGTSGDLHVGFNPGMLNDTFFDKAKGTWAALGQGVNEDVNSGTTAGFGSWPQTLDPELNLRWDSATAFYWPIQDRKNLKLLNGTVSKIVWKSGSKISLPEASGVEYFTPDNQRKILTAKKEVIISAGSLRTPLVLELSGIGNPQLLKKMGIETIVDSPGVGEHMIDQPNMSLEFSTNATFFGYPPYTTFANASSLFGSELGSIEASTKASLASWAIQVANSSNGALNATALEYLFGIQHGLIFEKGVTIAEILSTGGGNTLLSAYWDLLPFSRGSVHLSSVTDINKPSINPKYLSVDFDLQVEIAAGRLCQTFWSTEPISQFTGKQTKPDTAQLPPNATDSQWERATKELFGSNAHSIGTASMMAWELGGVVDPELKVYGTSNVRVVDASVLPMQFSGHLTATLYAVSERAAEFIIKARR
ncbi:Glucose oxidase [Cladobotryum mycophilum]|uniref:Glucose oxidase n=1 Tax=Cladobotryum mycophilum TaxID=491253 RepID=A0ABR0SW85_9HYPO